MSKKVLGALLALVMVLSVFSFTVFAAGSTSYETDASYTQTWGLSAPKAVTGATNTYEVEIYLTTNYPVGPVQFKLIGDDIEVIGASAGAGYYKATASAGKSGLVILTPDTSSTLNAITPVKATIATVQYTSVSGATAQIDDNEKTKSNPSGTLMAARLDGKTVNGSDFIVGQPAEVLKAGESMPDAGTSGGEADLVVKSGVAGVVVDTHKTFGGKYDGVVYGFAQAANNTFKNSAYITAALEATDGSALTITTSDGNADSGKVGNFGTGTTVKVGEKTYVICIFGDIDGNGLINTTDAQNTLAASTSGAFGDDTVITLAANVAIAKVAVPMHKIQTNDIQAIAAHVGGTKIDFAAVAKAHESFNTNYQ